MLLVVLLEVVLQASKTHPSPHRNTMLLKDGTTSKNMCPGAWRPFWILVKTKRVQLLGLLGLLGLLLLLLLLHAAGGTAGGGAASLQNAPFATPKHHATEGRNDLQKHAAPGLDVPSGFWKKKEIAAAGPAAAAAGAATRGGAASLQNAPFATPKHHATEGRNDLQINRKNKFPGGRNVPSEILSLILSCYRARILSYPAILLGPPKTCCPGAWRPFWILEKKEIAAVVVVIVVNDDFGCFFLLLLLCILATFSSCCCTDFCCCCCWFPDGKHHGKNHLPAGKHHASEGRRSPKIAPRKCLM